MDFSFTEEQTMLRDSVARFLEKNYTFDVRQDIVGSQRSFSADVWRVFGELGLLALPFPESVGGLGGSVSDLVAIGEPFGEHLIVEPYLSSILLTGRTLAAAAQHPPARAWLDRIIAGEALGAFAHEEGVGTADPAQVALRCEASGSGYRLTGEKRLVLGGADADVLVVTAREEDEPGEGLALLIVDRDTPGVRTTPLLTVDGRSAAHITFDATEVPAENRLPIDAHAAITDTIGDALIAMSAEAVGAMGALLRRTADYTTTREQFGVPIASFQAVAHRLAGMKLAHVKARATLLHTTAQVESGLGTARDLAILKAQTGRLGRTLVESAVQCHGGVGMTDELPVGHYLKRLHSLDALFGSADHHYRTIGATAGSVAR